MFYRFFSENFASYIEGGDDSIRYAGLADSVITPEIKDDAIKTKGYFIYPSQLFAKVVASANTNESLNTDLAAIFASIESSANGYPSEKDIKGLFADFDTTSNRLGNTVKDKNIRLAAVLKGVADLDFGDFEGIRLPPPSAFCGRSRALMRPRIGAKQRAVVLFGTPQVQAKHSPALRLHAWQRIWSL